MPNGVEYRDNAQVTRITPLVKKKGVDFIFGYPNN